MSKTADQLIPRPISQDSPDSASTGETPSEKSQKQLLLMTQISSSRVKRKDCGSGLGSDCLVEERFELV